jgi:alcohol dehydrogenase class IV
MWVCKEEGMGETVDKVICNRVVHHGPGAIERLDGEIQKLGAKRAGLITDPGVVNAGISKRVLEGISAEVLCFEKVEPEPSYELIDGCVEFLKEKGCDLVIGLGGGSAMDCAKMAAVMMKNTGKVTDYFGADRVPNPGLPVIAIPTTAGTGSEATPACVFVDPKDRVKKGVRSDFIVPEVAILDPLLTLGLPQPLTASTGMDALTHAIEAYASLRANLMSDIAAEQSIRLIGDHIRVAYSNGNDVSARCGMLMASFLGGVAIAVAGVGAVHALAHTLGGIHKIPHGVANALLLPYVMEFNRIGCRDRFARIASLLGERVEGSSLDVTSQRAVESVEKLNQDIGIPRHLRDLNIPEDSVDLIAERSIETGQRLLATNPRALSVEEAKEVLRMAY